MTRRWSLSAALAVVLVMAGAVPAPAYQRPGTTELISATPDGSPASRYSQAAGITPDGRYVAFQSEWPLTGEDDNQFVDVYLRDRATGVTHRISRGVDGEPNEGSFHPSVSADGRLVAFTSFATNLVAEDGNGQPDVFLHDRETGATTLVSVSASGEQGDDMSADAIVTADGSAVVFTSFASNMVPGDTNTCALGSNVFSCPDVFLRDLEDGSIERVSVATGGGQSDGWSSTPDVTPDGRFVTFQSDATNLAEIDTNMERDVFVHDRATGVTERVSVSSHGGEGNARSTNASISDDGRIVAFESGASNLVPRDGNQQGNANLPPPDVFVHDRATGITERVSLAADGADPDDWSIFPEVSGDGRWVAFQSYATNIVPGDTNETVDVFVRDLATGAVDRVSVTDDGEEANHWASFHPLSLSRDGRLIVWSTDAWNLVPGSAEGDRQVVLRDRGPELGIGSASADGARVQGWASFTGAVLAAAQDPGGDVPAPAEAAGADLAGASVVYRVEREEVVARFDVTRMPAVNGASPGSQLHGFPVVAGSPGVVYGLRFVAGGVPFELRAGRSATTAQPGAPSFILFRCQAACTEVRRIAGGYGAAADRVEIVVPIDAMPGRTLTGIRAFTAAGDPAFDPLGEVDEVPLADVSIPEPTVELAAPGATPGPPAGSVAAAQGRFEAPLEVEGKPWVRACLGEVCSAWIPAR